jgi:hypothetical protein
MSADSAASLVQQWKNNFQSLDSIAEAKVTEAASHLKNSADSSNYAEAQFNMTYAESDESGGVHNHLYSVELLNDAISKANLIVTGISSGSYNKPLTFNLAQNYPNPFNPATTISFEIAKAANVTLTVYNVLGQKVVTLVNERKTAGDYRINFDGSRLASGVYLYMIKAKATDGELFQSVRKMLLLK